jgi:valyl-tRNA synthetase
MALRPQAHEIIRTWTFYTIVRSYVHFNALPWSDVMISGWGLAPQGTGKISKSRGGGPLAPMEAIERYSADAVRYWAASGGTGKDLRISEEQMNNGARLVTKLWNAAGFSARFLEGYRSPSAPPPLSPADRWILSRTQRLVERVTDLFRAYDYAGAKSETEAFFWSELADNYVEMAKTRLYDAQGPMHEGARFALSHVLLTVVKLFAPIVPYVTEEIYRGLFAGIEDQTSVHVSAWPVADARLISAEAELAGEALMEVATAVRRYKSEHTLALGAPLERVHVATPDPALAALLREAREDIAGVTRARQVEIGWDVDPTLTMALTNKLVSVGIARC